MSKTIMDLHKIGSSADLGVALHGKVDAEGKMNDKTRAFARVDFYDPIDKAGDDREYLVIGGIDLTLADGIHLMPNFVATAYQDSDADADPENQHVQAENFLADRGNALGHV